jgi:hypothetical protein
MGGVEDKVVREWRKEWRVKMRVKKRRVAGQALFIEGLVGWLPPH